MGKKPKITINAPIIMSFVGLSILASFLSLYTNGTFLEQILSVYRSADMLDPLLYLRFVCHVFGSQSTDSLIWNMIILLAIGPMIEEKHSSMRVFLLILLIAVCTGITQFFLFDSGYSITGAQGVITGMLVMGAFTGEKDGSIPLSFLLVLIGTIGYHVYQGYVAMGDASVLAYSLEGIIGAFIGAILAFG